MSISTKVALSIAAVVFITAVVSFAYVVDVVDREQRTAFRSTAEESLQLLALSIAPAVATGRHDRVQAVLDAIANYPDRYPHVVSLTVVTKDARVMADLDPRQFNQKIERTGLRHDLALLEPRTTVDSGRLHVVVPIRLAYPLGLIQAQVDMSGLEAQLDRQHRQAIAIAVIASLLLGVGLYLALRRLVAHRLVRLAKVATRLREGRMEARADPSGGDEIGELAVAFNRMAEELEAYTTKLERIVRERTAALEEANTTLARLATTDPLTGLANRRHFEQRAARDLEIARRGGRPFSVVFVDADHFKSINDAFGHSIGDKVLRAIADVLRNHARAGDVVGRIGGEEFALAMPDASGDGAMQVADRMRGALEESGVDKVSGLDGRTITASFGVATYPDDGESLADLMQVADDALYRAKAAGRNRVMSLHAGPPVLAATELAGTDMADTEMSSAEMSASDLEEGS